MRTFKRLWTSKFRKCVSKIRSFLKFHIFLTEIVLAKKKKGNLEMTFPSHFHADFAKCVLKGDSFHIISNVVGSHPTRVICRWFLPQNSGNLYSANASVYMGKTKNEYFVSQMQVYHLFKIKSFLKFRIFFKPLIVLTFTKMKNLKWLCPPTSMLIVIPACRRKARACPLAELAMRVGPWTPQTLLIIIYEDYRCNQQIHRW